MPPPPAESPPLWQSAAGIVAAVWALFIALRYDKKFSGGGYSIGPVDAPLRFLGDLLAVSPANYINVIPEDLKAIALLVVLLAGCAAWGNLVLPKLEGSLITMRERLVLALAVGFIIFSSCLFLLGLTVGYTPGVLLTFLFGMTAIGIFFNKGSLQALRDDLKSVSWFTPLKSPANILLTLFLLLSFMFAFVPELFYDSLVYHLGIPQMFVNEGRMVDTPNVYFSRFPFLVHMLYVLGLGLDGSSLAKLINWSHFVVGLAAVGLILRRLELPKGTTWALLFVAALPVVQLNVWSTAIDVAQGAYTVLALFAFLLWRASGYESRRWLLLCGLFAGATFATKYTGVVIGMSFGLLVLAVHKPGTNRIGGAIVNGALFSLMIVLVMSPYLIRNFVWTGNPTYPILSKHFESRNLNQKQVDDEQGLIARSKPKTLKGWLTFPWTNTFMDTTSFNYIGPLVLGGLPMLFLVPWRKSRDLWWIGGVTAVSFLIALQFSGDIRYLIPNLFLLSVLLGAGFAGLAKLNSFVVVAVKAATLIVVYYHLACVSQMTGVYNPARVLMGAESRKNYSATMHNGLNLWPWNGMDDILRSLPDPCRVYILGNEQVWGFPRRFWYSSVHDYTPLVIWANESTNGEDLNKKMRDMGFTHILYNVPESIRVKGYDLFPWTAQGQKTFIDFARQNLKLAAVQPINGYENSLFLFELKKPGDAEPLPFDFEKYFKELLNFIHPS